MWWWILFISIWLIKWLPQIVLNLRLISKYYEHTHHVHFVLNYYYFQFSLLYHLKLLVILMYIRLVSHLVLINVVLSSWLYWLNFTKPVRNVIYPHESTFWCSEFDIGLLKVVSRKNCYRILYVTHLSAKIHILEKADFNNVCCKSISQKYYLIRSDEMNFGSILSFKNSKSVKFTTNTCINLQIL